MKKRKHNEIKSKYLKKNFFSQACSRNLMFLLYFILVSRWQVFYHLSKYHLRCLLWSEQEWVSIQQNQFQNPVKCIKSISKWSTLFVLSTFITIITIKLNSAIWDQVPAIVLHIHCTRRFKVDQAEERSLLWGEMGIQKSGTEKWAPFRDREQTHGRAAPPSLPEFLQLPSLNPF